jgi:hypothetical protein
MSIHHFAATGRGMNEDEKNDMLGVCCHIFRNSNHLVHALAVSTEAWKGSQSDTLNTSGAFLDHLRDHSARCMATFRGYSMPCLPFFRSQTIIDVDGYPLNEKGWSEMASNHMIMMYHAGTEEKLRSIFRVRRGCTYPDDWDECVERAVEEYGKLKVFGTQ